MQTLLRNQWHHLPADEVTGLLETDPQAGLDQFEIQARQARFGLNQLTPKRRRSPLLQFLQQFNNPLVYILLASSLVTAVLKDWVDALIILGVVLVNALVGYLQESRAERSIEALARDLTTEAGVIRAGREVRLDSRQLVPGDLVVLKSGDRVPADLRLVRSRDLQISEAALTGESAPVHKDATGTLPAEVVLAERYNMAYASTLVTYGQGWGVVVATGDATEIGRISEMIASAVDLSTPLTRKMAEFSQLVLYIILALSAFAILVGLWRGQALIDTVMAAIALAVAMIPEGLPAALTVTLAIGVARMARRRAIIRKLPAVEALGSTTVIATDKTGTLTQNEMTVQVAALAGQRYTLTGSGYNPHGEVRPDGDAQPAQMDAHPALAAMLAAGALCNDSDLLQDADGWQSQGDPTEIALLASAYKAGLEPEALRRRQPRLDVIPFESQHQYMATLHRLEGRSEPRAYIKGSLEAILARSAQALDAEGHRQPLDQASVQASAEELAGQGLRVLALAQKDLPAGQQQLAHDDIAAGLTFLGLQAMMDPPRPEAVAAVQATQAAGIQVKMITGDHALTAAAIARQIGLDAGETPPLTGQEMAAMSDTELVAAAGRTSVFARVSPEQKLRLVRALQARGQVVAMTGDGVNDGPALKQSDIGVAMGLAGTEVAKEAADMVLTDDNFATIAAAVEEGRAVFDNLTKIIAWTLPTNIGQGLVILAALLVGVALPILPIQVLWINMISVGVLGLVLALEPREPGLMQRRPRDPQAPILSRRLLLRTILVGALILVGAFGLFEWELELGAGLAEARTAAVNAVVFVGIFYLLNSRSLERSMFEIGVFSNRWVVLGVGVMVLLQLAFTYLPLFNRVLYSAPLTPDAWVRILGFGLLTYMLVEVEKRWSGPGQVQRDATGVLDAASPRNAG